MACPTEENSGLIDLVGPLQENMISSIATQKSPLQLSFSPRTTLPTLYQNQLDDLTGHTCILHRNTYHIINIQLTKPMHNGYQLPGQVVSPQAELILTFVPKSLGNMEESTFKGLLLCFPIYISNETTNGKYIEQLLFSKDAPESISSLSTLFSLSKHKQTSFAYATCFETVDGRDQFHTNTLYVHVYPRGIELKSSSWEGIKNVLGNQWRPYEVPTVIRGTSGSSNRANSTLYTYTIENGAKKKGSLSPEGQLYKTSISTSSDSFRNRFEYFKSSPMDNTLVTKQYKTSQYKCVPFDQLRDLKSPNDLKNSYVMPGGKDLGTVLEDKKTITEKQKEGEIKTNTLTTAQMEGIIGGTIGVIVVGVLAVYFSTRLSSNRS